LGLDPGDEGGEGEGPVFSVVLAAEEVGQLMAQGREALSRRVEHDGAVGLVGLSQEEGPALPVFSWVGEIGRVTIQVDRLLAKGLTYLFSPGFQV